MPDVAGLLADFRPDGKRYVLAAHVTGMAETAFPDGPPERRRRRRAKPKGAKTAATKTPAARRGSSSRRIRSMSSSSPTPTCSTTGSGSQSQDFFGQQVIVPIANNGDFVANAVDVLAGGQDLIGLRSRGTAARPFEVVDRIQRQAQARYSTEEQGLQAKLKATEAQLAGLTGKNEVGAPATLSPDQSKAVEQFRADMLQTRRQLREVQAALRRNIQELKEGFEFLDIALIPIIVAVAAIIVGAVRVKRRRRRAVEA